MTELDAAAKDFAISHKMDLREPTLITHTIELMEDAFKAGSKYGSENIKIDFERLLKELMDRDLLKNWYYNGKYHYEFKEITSVVPLNDIPWDYKEDENGKH